MVNTHLRATLGANGYTEADLANELGVDAKTVQRWVTQDRTPHRSTAIKVAKLLDVPVAWLWPGLDEDSAGESRQEVVASTRTGPTPPSGYGLSCCWARKQRNRPVRQREPVPARGQSRIHRPDPAQGRKRHPDPHPARRPGHTGDGTPRAGRTPLRRTNWPYPHGAGLLPAAGERWKASPSTCTAPRCTTRSSATTTRCWSTSTFTAPTATSRRSCTCAASRAQTCSTPT